MSPISRIILAILGAAGLGLALCAALVFGGLDRLSLRTAEANVDFLSTQLRETIEANVSLGLPLSDIRLVQDLIERAKLADPQVLAVEVFSPDGLSLFNTDRGSIGEPILPMWQLAIRYRIQNDRWRIEEFDTIVVGQPIRNDFGEPVGYLALTVSGEARTGHALAVLSGLGQAVAILLPAVLLVVLIFSGATFGVAGRGFRRLAATLASDPPVAEASPLAVRGKTVRSAVDHAVVDLDRATAEVLGVDEREDRHAA
jgi:hypothetical protein